MYYDCGKINVEYHVFMALAALRKHLANTLFTHHEKTEEKHSGKKDVNRRYAGAGKPVLNIVFSWQKPLRENT